MSEKSPEQDIKAFRLLSGGFNKKNNKKNKKQKSNKQQQNIIATCALTDRRCWVGRGISTRRWKTWPRSGQWRRRACWGCPWRWPASTQTAAVCARSRGSRTACTPSSGTRIPDASNRLRRRRGTERRTATSCRASWCGQQPKDSLL